MGIEADCDEYLELKNCQCETVSKNLWNNARYICTRNTKLPLLVTKTDKNKSVHNIQWHRASSKI